MARYELSLEEIKRTFRITKTLIRKAKLIDLKVNEDAEKNSHYRKKSYLNTSAPQLPHNDKRNRLAGNKAK